MIVEHSGCFHHADRPSCARCPVCRRFFCTECIAEHDGKVICAYCLAAKSAKKDSLGRKPRRFAAPFLSLVGFLILFAFFHAIGWMILKIPVAVHEGSFWENGF